MKQLLIKPFVISLLIPLYSLAQSNAPIDTMEVFAQTKSTEAETLSNIQATTDSSIALCTQSVKDYPIPKQELFTNIHSGIGIYSDDYSSNIVADGYKNGALYLAVGADASETSKLIPYHFITFSKPGVTGHIEPSPQYQRVNVFDISSGIMRNGSTTENVFSSMRKPDPLRSKADYKDKSKRQKTTGMVLLITGMALLTTSIVIASHQEVLSGVGTLFYVGGPGIILSLTSIPFLVSAAHNKSKWMDYK